MTRTCRFKSRVLQSANCSAPHADKNNRVKVDDCRGTYVCGTKGVYSALFGFAETGKTLRRSTRCVHVGARVSSGLSRREAPCRYNRMLSWPNGMART